MPDARPLGLGLIGCGGIAGTHAAAAALVPGDVRIVAVCDEQEARARKLGEQLGVPWFIDRGRLLGHPGLDAVSICTPSGLHGELGAQAAAAGKHVITEKPVEVDPERADALIAACRTAGVTLAMISQYRFHPAMDAIRAAVAAGRFGRLTLGVASTKWYRGPAYFTEAPWRGTPELDGGSCLTQGIHAIDQLLAVMGPVAAVAGFATTRFQKIRTEDTAAGSLVFASGALGVIETTTVAYPSFAATLELTGTTGTVCWELGESTFRFWRFADGTPPPVIPPVPWEASHARQFADFARAVRTGTPPAVTGEDGRRTVAVIHALYQSSVKSVSMEGPR